MRTEKKSLRERMGGEAQERQPARTTYGTGTEKEFRSNFFSTRVISEWNSLPNDVKEAVAAKIFKRLYSVQALSSGHRDARLIQRPLTRAQKDASPSPTRTAAPTINRQYK